MSAKTLHILTDTIQTNWYIDKCLKYAPDVEQVFIAFAKQLHHLKTPSVQCCAPEDEVFEQWAERIHLGEFDRVVINYFDMTAARLIHRVRTKNVPIIWVVWGADLYTLPFFWDKLFDPAAAKIVGISAYAAWRKRFRLWYRRVRFGNLDHRFMYRAMKKVTHCATLIDADVALVRKKLQPRVEQIRFSFSGIEDFRQALQHDVKKENSILIGNSADPANNHIEVLRTLNSIGANQDIYIPFSYGHHKIYKQEAPALFHEIYPSHKIHLQENNLPKEEYYRMLQRMSFAIMGHIRQQAFANIIALLYFGAKVFLRKRNPLIHTFQQWGLQLFCVEDDLNSGALSHPLSQELQEKNRAIIDQLLSEQHMESYYRDLVGSKMKDPATS